MCRTIKFLNQIELPVKHILVNQIVPDFGEEIWLRWKKTRRRHDLGDTNPTTLSNSISFSRFRNQVRLVGITHVPFEPMGLPALAKFQPSYGVLRMM